MIIIGKRCAQAPPRAGSGVKTKHGIKRSHDDVTDDLLMTIGLDDYSNTSLAASLLPSALKLEMENLPISRT